MPDFLIFQLYGAMSAWGDIAVGESRPSYAHPSKSAITGILAAALGIERNNEKLQQQLAQKYAFAVCMQSSGELLRDFHTVQVPGGKKDYATRKDELSTEPLKLNTILSQRDYRMDGVYQVAVWCVDDDAPYTLKALQQSLSKPHFNLYLGRKSCPPSLPLHPIIFSKLSLKQALDNYPACDWFESLIKSSKLVSYFWEDGNLSDEQRGMAATMSYPRRDQVLSRERWQFSNRNEFYFAQAIKGGS